EEYRAPKCCLRGRCLVALLAGRLVLGRFFWLPAMRESGRRSMPLMDCLVAQKLMVQFGPHPYLLPWGEGEEPLRPAFRHPHFFPRPLGQSLRRTGSGGEGFEASRPSPIHPARGSTQCDFPPALRRRVARSLESKYRMPAL